MTAITPEQKRAIEQAGDGPVRLGDPETNRIYVLIPAEQYDRIERLIADEEDVVGSMQPLLADLSPEDWEDASNYGL